MQTWCIQSRWYYWLTFVKCWMRLITSIQVAVVVCDNAHCHQTWWIEDEACKHFLLVRLSPDSCEVKKNSNACTQNPKQIFTGAIDYDWSSWAGSPSRLDGWIKQPTHKNNWKILYRHRYSHSTLCKGIIFPIDFNTFNKKNIYRVSQKKRGSQCTLILKFASSRSDDWSIAWYLFVKTVDVKSCRGLVVMSCDSHSRGKSHWWTTGRASGPKMITAPAKSQLTIGHRPSPFSRGVCDVKPHHQNSWREHILLCVCVCGILDFERSLLPSQSGQCLGEFMGVGSHYLPPPIVFILGQAGFEPTTSGVRAQCLNHETTAAHCLNIISINKTGSKRAVSRWNQRWRTWPWWGWFHHLAVGGSGCWTSREYQPSRQRETWWLWVVLPATNPLRIQRQTQRARKGE